MESRRGLRRSSSLAKVAVFVLLAAPVVAEQTIYTWTDEKGVVHFADEPPLDVQGVERRVLSVPPAAVPVRPATEAPATPDGTVLSPGESEASEARVVVLSSETPRLGPSSLQVSGKVKNEGGRPANGVTVTVTVLDDTQHNPCLNTNVSVDPESLEPGETGKFDAELDNPCLYGNPSVRFEADWD
jgi:hypothetical protein